MLAVAGLVVIALAARLGFAVAGGFGLWFGAAFASLAVWAAVDRYRRM
jgi:hypothetical protein